MSKILRARGTLAATASLIAVVLATPVLAQTASPGQGNDNVPPPTVPAAQEPEDQGQEIVVTGSRIRRPDFETPNPVISLGQQTLQAAGTTNLTDFLTGYPALQGSLGSADNSGDRAGIGATGLNLLNLRNLGTERTLVLVDGRRHVAALPGSQSVDINTIPTDLVERIDVLTGGVSAIYGADGVSGVVNFIMKKDFEGITARGQAGISDHGDAGKRLFDITVGKNFAGGRGNIALAYEYAEEDRLQTRDRKRLRGTNATRFFLNPDDPENQDGYDGPVDNGIPDYVPLKDIRYYDTARQGGIDLDFDGLPDYFVNANGAVTPFDHGRFVPTAYQQGGSATLVSDYGNDLLPEIKRHVVNALAHFEISPAVEIFAEGKYARTKSFSLGQPTFDYYLLIPEDNPYIPDALRSAIADAGNGGVLVNRDNFDLGQRGEDITRETYRFVGGVRGDLGKHANYEVSYTFGQTDVTNHYIGDILDDRFYAAIDAVRDANGNIVCRAAITPNWEPDQPYASRDVFSPTTFNPSACVPMNLFGENAMSQAAKDFVRVNTTDRARLRQQVISASLSGDFGQFFELPGGAIGFAVGAEYRKEESSFTPDPIAAQGLTFTNSLAVDKGKFDVTEEFAELNVPVFKDMPFFHRLSFGAAIRFSDYSTIGNTTAWKFDGTWAPVRDITFTGTYSKAVRAPNIGELFGGRSQTFEFITDPCNQNELQNGTSYRAANCQALLSSLGVADPSHYSDDRSTNISGFSVGNENLSEESAKTWTAGVILQPRFVPGLTVRGDWYDIRIKQAINQATAEEIAELCVDQPTLDNQYCPLIVRQTGTSGTADPGNIDGFTVQPFNVAQFRTSGLDLNINYSLRTKSIGRFNLNVIGNYLNRLEFIPTPGAPVNNDRMEARAPKYTVNADLTWSMGNVTLNYGLTWFDKTLRDTNQSYEANPDRYAPEYTFFKEHWQHDIYASVDVTDRFQVYGGVNNVFGQKPDIGTINYPVNSIGRYMFVGARVKMPKL